MLRTLIVLVFLGVCGLWISQNPADAPSAPEKAQKLDDSLLQAMKRVIPSPVFDKEIQPVLERNRAEGLTPSQIEEAMASLHNIGRALGGKAKDAAEKASAALESLLPPREGMADRAASTAGDIARSLGEGVKESLPAAKEISAEILHGLATVVSRLLGSAADLLQN